MSASVLEASCKQIFPIVVCVVVCRWGRQAEAEDVAAVISKPAVIQRLLWKRLGREMTKVCFTTEEVGH